MMLVNELAKKAGVQAHVVRYYSRIGLLEPRRNPENGYQLFANGDVLRLERIQQLQGLGFSLAEVKRCFENTPDCAHIRAGLERNIARNRRRIAELTELQHRMEAAVRAVGTSACSNPFCAGACGRSGAARLTDWKADALDVCAGHSR